MKAYLRIRNDLQLLFSKGKQSSSTQEMCCMTRDFPGLDIQVFSHVRNWQLFTAVHNFLVETGWNAKLKWKRFSESSNKKGKITEITQDHEHKKLLENAIYKKYELGS